MHRLLGFQRSYFEIPCPEFVVNFTSNVTKEPNLIYFGVYLAAGESNANGVIGLPGNVLPDAHVVPSQHCVRGQGVVCVLQKI